MRVAVLGLGEAGRVFAEGFADRGHDVVGFDPADVSVDTRIQRSRSVAEAVTGADVILSLTTAAHAVTAATEAAQGARSGAIYIDVNAGAPALKEAVRDAIQRPDVSVVDGAVIGSVRSLGVGVEVLLAGSAAEEAAQQLTLLGGNPNAISDVLGDASRRKLLRSVFMKGLGALISESMDAADAAGEHDWMEFQIAEALADGVAGVERLHTGTHLHAARRARELSDSLAGLGGSESAWPMTSAARNYHLRSSHSTMDLSVRLAAIPTAALGDAGDRLGLLHSAVKPVWEAPAVAGRALTVWTRPGDNAAVHQALEQARPGDILMVAGGGHLERALMGELIGERAVSKGIRAFITDGAVRDAEELARIGFPVWSAGVSPAGPYKDGPGRVDVPISIGGVVCLPGDYVVADADGVIVIPGAQAETLAARGEAVLEDEARRRREILRARESGETSCPQR